MSPQVNSPRTESDIAKNEHDYTLDAKRVVMVGETIETVIGQGTVSVTDASAENIGGDGTGRKAGILIVNHGSNDAYLSFGGTPAGPDWSSEFRLKSDGFVITPFTVQVKAICASGESASLSYVEG